MDELLERGIVEVSSSPWSETIVIVIKKSPDGSPNSRFCTDILTKELN